MLDDVVAVRDLLREGQEPRGARGGFRVDLLRGEVPLEQDLSRWMAGR